MRAAEPLYDINVPATNAADALNRFAEQTGAILLFPYDLARTRQANAVRGRYTLLEGLQRLLEGTGLSGGLSDKRVVSISQTESARHPGEEGDMLKKKVSLGTKIAAFFTSVLSVSAARGQNVDAQVETLEEVIVTAQKREERLRDVPVPVTALNSQDLLQGNQLRIQDFASNVPGFSASPSPSAGGQQQLAIRGISTGFNTNPTVGITVDDVPYGASTNLVGNSIPDIDPNDLARVEVLRGPQGALYGASSMGGLVKFVTRDPSTDGASGHIDAGMNSVRNGDELGYSVRASGNLPLGETAAMRASAFTRRDAGYIDNPVLGTEGVNEARVSGGRVAFLWRPSETLSLKLSALAQKAEGDGTNDVAVVPGLGDLEQNYIPDAGSYERKAQAYSATLSMKLGAADLTALSGYNETDFRDSFDFTYLLGPLLNTGVPVFTHNKARKFSQEVRLLTPLGERVEWLVGVFYTHENTPQAQDLRTEDPTTGVLGPSLLALNVPTTYEEYAAFSDLTFHITDRFDLQVGGRGSRVKHSASETQTGPLAGAATPESTSKDTPFTYLLTPRWKITDDVMTYARFASGYRAGGPNGNPDPSVPRTYEPDTTQTYELGLKGDFLNQKLSLDASLYYIKWDKIQLNLVAPNSQTYTTNGEKAKSNGVEVSVELRPITGLRIGAWAVYNDAELTDPVPPNQGVFGFDGDRLPYGSRISGNLSVDEEFGLGSSSWTGSVGASVSYIGDRFGTFIGPPLSSDDRERFPPYARTDLRAGVRNDNWSVNLFVTNLTDRRGVLGGGAGTFPPFSFSVIQPRTIGLTLSRSFGGQ